jgi:hypothetical protein
MQLPWAYLSCRVLSHFCLLGLFSFPRAASI